MPGWVVSREWRMHTQQQPRLFSRFVRNAYRFRRLCGFYSGAQEAFSDLNSLMANAGLALTACATAVCPHHCRVRLMWEAEAGSGLHKPTAAAKLLVPLVHGFVGTAGEMVLLAERFKTQLLGQTDAEDADLQEMQA